VVDAKQSPIFEGVKIVVDTNIAFSAILNTDSRIGSLLLNSQDTFVFYTCDLLRAEIELHHDKLLDLSGYSRQNLDLVTNTVCRRLTFISESLIAFEHWKNAADLVRDIDMDDIAFVALNEFLKAELWTGDKKLSDGLLAKGYYKVVSTAEMLKRNTKTV
jgi:predicted nucleic acid-binding protein